MFLIDILYDQVQVVVLSNQVLNLLELSFEKNLLCGITEVDLACSMSLRLNCLLKYQAIEELIVNDPLVGFEVLLANIGVVKDDAQSKSPLG